LDMMNADQPLSTLQWAVPIHPTVSELIPTLVGDLRPAWAGRKDEVKSRHIFGIEAPMPKMGRSRNDGFHFWTRHLRKGTRKRYWTRYSGYPYATLTGYGYFTRPPVRHRPPAISLRTNHLFRISSLAQSRLRMGQEYYPSVRYARGRLHCIGPL